MSKIDKLKIPSTQRARLKQAYSVLLDDKHDGMLKKIVEKKIKSLEAGLSEEAIAHLQSEVQTEIEGKSNG